MGIISNEHGRAKKDGALEAYKPKNYDKVDKNLKILKIMYLGRNECPRDSNSS